MSSQVSVKSDGALFSWGGLSTVYPWEVVNEALVSLYLLNCLYSSHRLSHILTLLILSHNPVVMSKWLLDISLLAGVKHDIYIANALTSFIRHRIRPFLISFLWDTR